MVKSLKLFLKNLGKNNTIMLIPHNEKSIKNIHLSNFFLYVFAFFTIFSLVLVSFFIIRYSIHSKELEHLSKFHILNQKKVVAFDEQLDHLNHQVTKLLEDLDAFSNFQTDKPSGVGGLEWDYEELNQDMQQSFDKEVDYPVSPIELAQNNSKHLDDSYLISKEMARFFQKRSDFMQALPTLWPIRNKKGNVIKKSENKMDIRLIGGEEVIATGMGEIKDIYLNSSGLVVRIDHGYGIFSKYSGLQSVAVKPKEKIARGVTLGVADSLVTYRIRIASKYVDPKLFTIIR